MNCFRALIGAALLLAAPALLLAQDTPPPRLVRGDISGTVGWVKSNKSEITTYNNWHGQAEASLAFGWYWTDHHETEIEVGTTSQTSVYGGGPIQVAGVQSAYGGTYTSFSTRRVAVIQHYPFRRNQWLHPFVGAGLDIVHERQARRDDPVVGYDPITRQSRQVRGAVDYGETTDVSARGVLTAGVKAYFSGKVFALADVRVSAARRVEDVQWRIGLGVDF